MTGQLENFLQYECHVDVQLWLQLAPNGFYGPFCMILQTRTMERARRTSPCQVTGEMVLKLCCMIQSPKELLKTAAFRTHLTPSKIRTYEVAPGLNSLLSKWRQLNKIIIPLLFHCLFEWQDYILLFYFLIFFALLAFCDHYVWLWYAINPFLL